MLRSFRLENHRSFRDEAELSLLPAYGKDQTPVRVVAVYGANAAGKSNLLDGLRFMSLAVRDSYRRWEPAGGVPRTPFRLQADYLGQPSTYVIELMLVGVRYVYGFVIDDVGVREEWLHSYPKGRRRVLFERELMEFDLGESLGGSRGRADAMSELTRPNALFLSLAAQVGIEDLLPVYDWFGAGISWSDAAERALPSAVPTTIIRALQGKGGERRRFLSLLEAADVGISDVIVDQADAKLVDAVRNEFASMQAAAEEAVRHATLSGDETALREANERRKKASERLRETIPKAAAWPTVKFRHGESALFDLVDESAGTRSWLSLLPEALSVLDRGGLLMIDEIDASLHPNLTALLIRQFQSPETNPRGAQLFFTTHDATLLGTSFGEEVLARDQVWFVEKKEDGGSRLYPLTDFHPRTGENRERRYLGGSYGAIPVLGEPDLALPAADASSETQAEEP